MIRQRDESRTPKTLKMKHPVRSSGPTSASVRNNKRDTPNVRRTNRIKYKLDNHTMPRRVWKSSSRSIQPALKQTSESALKTNTSKTLIELRILFLLKLNTDYLNCILLPHFPFILLFIFISCLFFTAKNLVVSDQILS